MKLLKLTDQNYQPIRPIVPLLLGLLLLLPGQSQAFTQKGLGGAIPTGHEWLTTLSAIELFGAEWQPSPEGDPRRMGPPPAWLADTSGLAALQRSPLLKSLLAAPKKDNYYHSTYEFIYAAIIGQRWVDIAGVNVLKAKWAKHNCWDAVAQEDDNVQYDHFMRRFKEHGAERGASAADSATARFIRYFVAAATAKAIQMKVWDGGGNSRETLVHSNFFLFGRALHLFQDSFSPEHTVRLAEDGYRQVRQVKSYMCSRGSEQHLQDQMKVINYESGDVIWTPRSRRRIGKKNLRASNMKTIALVATEATKELWIAFLTSLNAPQIHRADVARQQAEALARRWFSYHPDEMAGWYKDPAHRDATYVFEINDTLPGQEFCACLANLKIDSCKQETRIAKLEEDRCNCLYNITPEPGFEDLSDAHLSIPYLWTWKSRKWLKAPGGWKPPQRHADAGRLVSLRAKGELKGLYKDDRHRINASGYGSPLRLVQVGQDSLCYFRDADSGRFIGYRRRHGRLGLVAKAKRAAFALRHSPEGTQLLSHRAGTELGMDKRDGKRLYLATRERRRKRLALHWVLKAD